MGGCLERGLPHMGFTRCGRYAGIVSLQSYDDYLTNLLSPKIILRLVVTLKPTISSDSLEYCQFQIAAHNKHKHLLQRDTSLVVILTFVVLLLGAFLANTCVQILRHHGYIYTTSSFGKHPFCYLEQSELFMLLAQVIILERFHRENIRVYVYEACQSTSTIRI